MMSDWLVRKFTLFGVPVQNWMFIALVMILIGIAVSWWSRGSINDVPWWRRLLRRS
jgi:cell division protein FtsX